MIKTGEISALVLAYVGDAVLELLVRSYLIEVEGLRKPDLLQKRAVAFVSAKAQQSFIEHCKVYDLLSEEEWAIYRRGRNSKTKRHLETSEHHESTGFEAVLGTLYLNHDEKRLKELFNCYCQFIRGEDFANVDLRQECGE